MSLGTRLLVSQQSFPHGLLGQPQKAGSTFLRLAGSIINGYSVCVCDGISGSRDFREIP